MDNALTSSSTRRTVLSEFTGLQAALWMSRTMNSSIECREWASSSTSTQLCSQPGTLSGDCCTTWLFWQLYARPTQVVPRSHPWDGPS
eukprot:6186764-Pleurochrysis_carterae.AAC.1